MNNLISTFIAQYANSPKLLALLNSANTSLGVGSNFDAFYSQVWNVQTATGYGLDVWGRIVGVSRNLVVATTPLALGFSQATGCQPFGQAPFYNGAPLTQNYRLSDSAYRSLILAKAATNIASSSSQSINGLLQGVFAGRGRCYVNDLHAMSIYYVFEFALTAMDLAIIQKSGVVPHPAGVSAGILSADPAKTFGFKGSGLAPLGQGSLFNGIIAAS